jgi:hypothetical protein
MTASQLASRARPARYSRPLRRTDLAVPGQRDTGTTCGLHGRARNRPIAPVNTRAGALVCLSLADLAEARREGVQALGA